MKTTTLRAALDLLRRLGPYESQMAADAAEELDALEVELRQTAEARDSALAAFTRLRRERRQDNEEEGDACP